eukprot:CAMPEP_0195324986 /NCGR_PEP_ID=MMETSP0708-20121125/8860_1 /TAXON_ID=33640 /ORGANISM="Asterionellopsis glacialis, Strain CCMP134" /LENGTH=140 /DNA_ID=CAMNT_0040392361 /DNA_START=125 /DNA_END=547 /DNA_ORIENTATION=-
MTSCVSIGLLASAVTFMRYASPSIMTGGTRILEGMTSSDYGTLLLVASLAAITAASISSLPQTQEDNGDHVMVNYHIMRSSSIITFDKAPSFILDHNSNNTESAMFSSTSAIINDDDGCSSHASLSSDDGSLYSKDNSTY